MPSLLGRNLACIWQLFGERINESNSRTHFASQYHGYEWLLMTQLHAQESSNDHVDNHDVLGYFVVARRECSGVLSEFGFDKIKWSDDVPPRPALTPKSEIATTVLNISALETNTHSHPLPWSAWDGDQVLYHLTVPLFLRSAITAPVLRYRHPDPRAKPHVTHPPLPLIQ